MKTIPQLPLIRALRLLGTFLAVLAACFAAGLAAAHAAPPSVQPLLQGKWPAWPRVGSANDVKVVGNYAYVTDYDYESDDPVSGPRGLEVIDMRNPANCVRVGGYVTNGFAWGVTVVAGRIYVADDQAGLVVLPTLPNVQFTVRVDATPGAPFTLEAATNLNAPIPWTPLLTTNVPAMPFDYVDFDARLSDKPHKFYRVRQP